MKPKCSRCGTEFTPGGYLKDLCESCYAERWDAGFSSSHDYSERMYHRDLNDEFEELAELDEPRQKTIATLINHFGKGAWSCGDCEAVRVSRDTSDQLDHVVSVLAQPCPNCGVMGRFRHDLE